MVYWPAPPMKIADEDLGPRERTIFKGLLVGRRLPAELRIDEDEDDDENDHEDDDEDEMGTVGEEGDSRRDSVTARSFLHFFAVMILLESE
jgi:hypothetical protein